MLRLFVISAVVAFADANDTIEKRNWWVNTVTEDEVKFTLYNQYNIEEPDRLYLGKIDEIPIDGTIPFKILGHSNGGNPLFWYADAINAYLENGDANVIIVDWSNHYFGGRLGEIYAAPQIAKYVANLVLELKEYLGIPLENVHLVGHSYGAHVFGLAGQNVYTETKDKIGRITGLDPDGSFWMFVPQDERLSPDDAKFVDVIHSSVGQEGFSGVLGDVDIFPNGGLAIQPGCSVFSSCSQNRAAAYYVESITSKEFIARRCGYYIVFLIGFCNYNEKIVIGEHIPKEVQGKFYLTTNSVHPFVKGESGI